MKDYEEQVNMFDLDISEPLQKKDRKKELTERKERNKLFIRTTCKISNILDKDCSKCPFNQGDNNRIKCLPCDSYKELRVLGDKLESLTSHKIHKESWDNNKSDRKDRYIERLYTYDNLADLEKHLEVERMRELREEYGLNEIAEMIDSDYKVLRSFVNKYKLNKREDGTYYNNKKNGGN